MHQCNHRMMNLVSSPPHLSSTVVEAVHVMRVARQGQAFDDTRHWQVKAWPTSFRRGALVWVCNVQTRTPTRQLCSPVLVLLYCYTSMTFSSEVLFSQSQQLYSAETVWAPQLRYSHNSFAAAFSAHGCELTAYSQGAFKCHNLVATVQQHSTTSQSFITQVCKESKQVQVMWSRSRSVFLTGM